MYYCCDRLQCHALHPSCLKRYFQYSYTEMTGNNSKLSRNHPSEIHKPCLGR